jgi:hypothetical protein
MFLRLITNLVCPALGAGVVLAPLLRRPRKSPWPEWGRVALAIGWVYVLTLADRGFHWWPAAGLDFSTHTGIALALAIPLGVRERRLRPWLALLLTSYAAFMIALRYHTLLDILTTAAVVAPVAFLAARPRAPVVQPSA